MISDRNALPEFGSPRELAELYDADPDCDHVIVEGNFGSGIKCAKCPGWFCF